MNNLNQINKLVMEFPIEAEVIEKRQIYKLMTTFRWLNWFEIAFKYKNGKSKKSKYKIYTNLFLTTQTKSPDYF